MYEPPPGPAPAPDGRVEHGGPERLRVGGRVVTVRSVEADDVTALIALYEGLSSDDTYHRFFSAAPSIPPLVEHWVARARQVGGRLVAALDDGGIVADAGFTVITDGEWAGDAEFDITVHESVRGWFGSFLLDGLVDEARRAGVRNLQAHILRENRPMLALVARRGYVVLEREEPTEVHVAIGVQADMPMWPERHERLRAVVESRAADWELRVSAQYLGMTVVVCPGPVEGPRPRCPAVDGRPCPLAAAADVIVHAIDAGDPRGAMVLDAHRRLHPSASVVVETGHDDSRPLPEGARRILRGDPRGAEQIVRFLGREPRLPRRRGPES